MRVTDIMIINVFITFLSFAILPFWLLMRERKRYIEMTHCSDVKKFKKNLKQYLTTKKQNARFIKTELSIETSLQVGFAMLLMIFSKSSTRTSEGLEKVFDNTDESYGIPPVVLIVLNALWSLFTACRAYVKGFTSTKQDLSTKPKMVLAGFALLSICANCATTMHFLAPSLGLYDILRWSSSGQRGKKNFHNGLLIIVC